MVRETSVRKTLETLADPKYQSFQQKIIPTCPNILGVRIPVLRKYAKQMIKEQTWSSYLKKTDTIYMEETMLKGILIGSISLPIEERMQYILNFLPYINNWAVCDIFVSGLKCTKTNRELMYPFILQCLSSDQVYTLRFGIVMLLNYYVDKEHLASSLQLFENITNKDYYVQMALAWAISIYYIAFPEEVEHFLKNNTLDRFIQNKTISKICDSKVVSQIQKEQMKQYRK